MPNLGGIVSMPIVPGSGASSEEYSTAYQQAQQAYANAAAFQTGDWISSLFGINRREARMSLAQQQLDLVSNAWEAQKAYDRELDYNQRKYQDTVKDLKAAGLNPGLLFGGANASTVSAPSARVSSYGAAGSSGGGLAGALIRALPSLVLNAFQSGQSYSVQQAVTDSNIQLNNAKTAYYNSMANDPTRADLAASRANYYDELAYSELKRRTHPENKPRNW